MRATWTRIGATPATLTMSGWTTPSVNPAATPASMALPPAREHARAGLGGQRVTGGDGPAGADRLHGRGRAVNRRALLGRDGVEAHGRVPLVIVLSGPTSAVLVATSYLNG